VADAWVHLVSTMWLEWAGEGGKVDGLHGVENKYGTSAG
jgi:hypothetical protein